MDHGGYMGPIQGIESIVDSVRKVVLGGADALLVQKGILKACSPEVFGDAAIILRISGAADYLNEPFDYLTSSCEEAVRLGADGVAMTIYLGGLRDSEGFGLFGKIADEADKWGLPLLGECVPAKNPTDISWIKRAARIGAELGADMIKTCHSKPFREIADACPVPIVVLGGEKMSSTREVLEVAYDAMQNGAVGTCIGRNIFQHNNPTAITRAISEIVHHRVPVEKALAIAEEPQTQ
jgi:fructose-bisphosphate aldolase/2-amino-3,7-dideoxy-D-threo-hept-6-ulosonate synthase